tara:strand:+ start:75 stop:392 length:318 start_codon:yes stop_codon:yes gene_type:complete
MTHIGGLGQGPVHENDPNRININNNENINFEAILAEFEEEVTPKKVKKRRLSETSPDIDVKRPFYTNSIDDSIPGVDKNEKITSARYMILNEFANNAITTQLPNL